MRGSGAHNPVSGVNEAFSGENNSFSGERVTNIKTRTVKSPTIVPLRTPSPGTSHLIQQKPTNHTGSGLSKILIYDKYARTVLLV